MDERAENPTPADLALDKPDEELPFRIELWEQTGLSVERLVARANTMQLAMAIFLAAQLEHPMRRITVRHGQRFVSDTLKRPDPQT